MLPRLARASLTLLAVVAVYWLYALLVVPLVEPRAEAVTRRQPTSSQPEPPPPDRRKQLMARYFPPGSWELEHPKILENDRGMLLVQDYRNLPDGRVELKPCSMIMLPKGDDAEERAILLQAPGGAVLQFDEPFDLRRARVGRLVGGRLNGEIVVRSGPGAKADQQVRIVTREVQLDETRIWSDEAVEFQLGDNRGHGRGMEMLFAPQTDPAASKRGPKLGAVESFQLAREVKLHLELQGANLPGSPGGAGSPGQSGSTAKLARPKEPVDITCQGPFRFDLARNVATFFDQVDVLHARPQGPSDQVTCEQLSVHFERRQDSDSAAKSGRTPKLEPRSIEAVGNPVIVRMPADQGQARCQRLLYEFKSGRIVLEGSDDVLLNQGASEIRVPQVDYYPPSVPGELGKLLAVGPGTIQGSVEGDPTLKYQAQWTKELRVRPHQQCQLVSLRGEAQFRVAGMGSMSAAEIHVWLDAAATPPSRAPIQAVSMARPASLPKLHPDRMLATGNVRMDTLQLTGGMERLEVWFDDAASSSPTADPSGTRSGGPRQRGTQAKYEVGGSLVRVQLAMADGEPRPTDVTIEGGAHFAQSSAGAGQDQPLRVDGERLHVAHADKADAAVQVEGKPAQVEARGMALRGAKIQLERASNRFWIDGPGSMTVPVDRDLQGRRIAQPQPLEVSWAGGMSFDGRTATFDRTVLARSQQQHLRTDALNITLRERIDFGSVATGKNKKLNAEVERMRCLGKVYLENRVLGERGLQSVEQIEVIDLTVNQVTGLLEGRGPGRVTTVRRGGMDLPGIGAAVAAPAKPGDAPADDNRLSYLNVQFQKSVKGNILEGKRELVFADQIKTVFDRVDDWEQKPSDDPLNLTQEGAILTCDQLTVREMPAGGALAATRELEALGGALIEGKTFTARGQRLTYDQAKDQLVLEGDGRIPAQLSHQVSPGSPRAQWEQRRIMYWPKTKRVQIDDVRFVDPGPLPSKLFDTKR